MMFISSLNLQLFIFSLHLLKLLNYLPIVLFISFFLTSFDNSLAFCMDGTTQIDCDGCNKNTPSAPEAKKLPPSIMDGMNCHYQVDPFTKQPIMHKDGSLAAPVCKTNFGFMMDALRDMALGSQQHNNSSSTSW